MKKILTNNYIAIGAILGVVLIGGVYWYVATNISPSFGTLTVGRGNVIESVDQSGSIIAENNVNLSFQGGGQIAGVYVKEGDGVVAGTVLASLDQSSLKAAAEQAKAALAAAQAKLDGLMSGTRPEQIQTDESSVTNAQAALSVSLQSAYTAADDAVRNQGDNLFSNPEANPTLLIPDNDSQAVIDIHRERQALETTLKEWNTALTTGSSTPQNADASLQQIASYLNMLAFAVNRAVPSSILSAQTLAGYKLNIATARNEITSVITGLTAAETNLINAKNKLVLDQAGASSQDIEAQKAAVAQAQAGALSAQVALDHTVIVAPFGGTVQNLTAKVGQVVLPGTPVLSLVNNGGLKIEVYVSQADVAKIKEGDKANVTVDAYSANTPFSANVTSVGSTETMVSGTSAYKITLHFVNPDNRLKDGMTANVRIIATEHDNVLEVPSRLIVTDNSDHFVLVKNGGVTVRQKVETGIVGNDGMTEILSGLNVGDHVVTF